MTGGMGVSVHRDARAGPRGLLMGAIRGRKTGSYQVSFTGEGGDF